MCQINHLHPSSSPINTPISAGGAIYFCTQIAHMLPGYYYIPDHDENVLTSFDNLVNKSPPLRNSNTR